MSKIQSILNRLHALTSFEKTANPYDISPLSGIQQLLCALGHPERQYLIVHVVGTNGKGQTAAILAALLAQTGHRVGLYTSPHVFSIRDGIQIQNEWISEEALIASGETVLRAIDTRAEGQHVSYFDAMTAIALHAFNQASVDWAIVEAGMGGEADSTNAVPKALAVITPISYDHMEYLGRSLESIVDKKAGVVTPWLPVILAPQMDHITDYIVGKIHEKGGILAPTVDFKITPSYPEDRYECTLATGQTFSLHHPARKIPRPTLTCIGTALTTAYFIQNNRFETMRSLAQTALALSLPGRLQVLHQVRHSPTGTCFPEVILDGGHNGAALSALYEYLCDLGTQDYTIILGMARDKMTAHLHAPLNDLMTNAREIIFTQFSSERSATAGELQAFALSISSNFRDKITATETIDHALILACRRKPATLVIAGSFYLLQEAAPLLVFH